jgi:hypothetical protein
MKDVLIFGKNKEGEEYSKNKCNKESEKTKIDKLNREIELAENSK